MLGLKSMDEVFFLLLVDLSKFASQPEGSFCQCRPDCAESPYACGRKMTNHSDPLTSVAFHQGRRVNGIHNG